MKNRVVYGTRDLTAKQLATVLAKRCTKELPFNGEKERYAVSNVGNVGKGSREGSFTFSITRQVWLTKSESEAFCEREHRPRVWATQGWQSEWTASITVTKSLDIDLEDLAGRADLEALERTMLACALRGRDR